MCDKERLENNIGDANIYCHTFKMVEKERQWIKRLLEEKVDNSVTLKTYDHLDSCKANQKPKVRILFVSKKAQSSIKAPKRWVKDLGVSHSFLWNSTLLQNLKLLISKIMLKKFNKSRHDVRLEIFLVTKSSSSSVKQIVPTSCEA